MQWSDVTRKPPIATLRQFGYLCLVVFGGLAVWRMVGGRTDTTAFVLAAAGLLPGLLASIAPNALGPIFTGWMVLAFPIGWVVSRVMLAALFVGIFTPIALVFRIGRRDVLHRRRATSESYWTSKPEPDGPSSYFRQF